jgi:hypothetical protein
MRWTSYVECIVKLTCVQSGHGVFSGLFNDAVAVVLTAWRQMTGIAVNNE